jgi:ADP-heptose:LPS heptosyltransferase
VKDRTWAPHKFVSLARRISRLGFAPEFIVGPHERAHWQGIVRGGVPVRAFRRLKSASQYLFESGAMIGNDSSIGHLASMLAVPTLAIFCAGGRYLNMSRPGYTLGDVVVAPPPPSPRPRGWSWQRALTIDAVFAAFVDLSRRLPGRSPA